MSGFDVSDVLVGVDPGAGDVGVIRACALVWDRLAAGFVEFVGHTGSAVGVLQDLSAVSVSALMSTLTARGDVVRGLACQAGVVAEAVRGYARDVEDVQSRVVSIRVQVRSDVDVIVGCARQVRYWCGQAGYVVAGGRRWDDVPPLVPGCGSVSGVGVEYARNQYEYAVRNWRARVESLRVWQRQYVMVMDDRNAANVRFRAALGGVKISQQITGSGVTAVVGSMVALLSGGSGVADVAGLWSVLSTLATPDDVAAYWASLTDGQREALVDAHDDVIGNMNGIDYTSRDKANRKHVDNLLCDYAVSQNDAECTSLIAISNALKSKPNTYLISLDVSDSSEVLAAVAVGNLDTASKAVYIVPGMNAKAKDMGSLVADAENVHTGVPDSAVVAWIGYKTPSEANVLGDDVAAAGAVKLENALQGYNAVRPAGSQLTIIGHSYGSTTAANALASSSDHLNVDQFITIGSAGITYGAWQKLNEPTMLKTYSTIAAKDQWATFGQSNSWRINPNAISGNTPFSSQSDGSNGLKSVERHGLTSSGDWTDPGNVSYLDRDSESFRHIENIINDGAL